MDPAHCGLGRFMNSYRPANMEISSLIEQLKPVHSRLHNEADVIAKKFSSGESKSEVMDYFQSEIMPIFDEVISMLYKWIVLETNAAKSYIDV
jgi:hypothetical protein